MLCVWKEFAGSKDFVGFPWNSRLSLRDQSSPRQSGASPFLCRQGDDGISRPTCSCRELGSGPPPASEGRCPSVSPSGGARDALLALGVAGISGPDPAGFFAMKPPAGDVSAIRDEGISIAGQLLDGRDPHPAQLSSSTDDLDGDHGAWSDPSGGVTTSPAGLPQDDYVIIPESSADHGSIDRPRRYPTFPTSG